MKKVLACVLLLGLTCAAQAAGNPQASAKEISVPDGTRIPVEITEAINAKKAKIGDLVKLEVTKDVLAADGSVLIPHSAKLFGKVAEAVARSKQNPESRLALVVEMAQWKGGWARLNGLIVGKIRPPVQFGLEVIEIRTGGQGSIAEMASPPPSVYSRLPGDEADPRKSSSLPDVELRLADNPRVGSVLVSKKKDVVLEGGTTFVIQHTVVQGQ
jgi:hypothetical protein